MIPKIIHFCWFGHNPYPDKVKKCIQSWKKLLPEYEIICWNEENFDVNICQFTRDAYKKGKYAFVSDYARLYVLNKYGGIYLDVDVEVIKPFDDILNNKMIIALDETGDITGAFLASEKNQIFLQALLNLYNRMPFIKKDGSLNMTVNNIWMQKVLKQYGYIKANRRQHLADDIEVFPDDYFHARSNVSGKLRVTSRTYCIHYHTLLWVSNKTRLIKFIRFYVLVPVLGYKKYQKMVKKIRALFGQKKN